MRRIWGTFISITVVVLVAFAAAVWMWHIRSWNEAGDVALSLQRLVSPGYVGIFKAENGPPETAHATDYVVEILKTDNTVETRTLSLPGVDGTNNLPFAPGYVKIYAQRVMGDISIAVQPDLYVLRKGDGVFDHVYEYGAVIDPGKLPKNYIGSLRDHAVSWEVEDGTKLHRHDRPDDYFQRLNGCGLGKLSTWDDNGTRTSRPDIHLGETQLWGDLPEFAAGGQTFYITQPDRRACEHGGNGDKWNTCEDILAFDGPSSAFSSGRCSAMGVPLLDSCALVGELLLCNLEGVTAVRLRRKLPLTDREEAPVYFIATSYLDGGARLPLRSDVAAYEKALERLSPERSMRALTVQARMAPVPLN